MAITLKQLKRIEKRTVIMQYDGEEIKVTYNARVITPAFLAGMRDGDYAGTIGALVISWDVLDESGQELDKTAETVNALETDFLQTLINACVDDIRAFNDERKNA